MHIINGKDHHIIRLREPYRRWLILHYGEPHADLVIESGTRSNCWRYLLAAIERGDIPKPLYVIYAKPKNYAVSFPGADR